MNAAKKRILSRQRRRIKIKSKIKGTAERPRICVFRSLHHIYVQAIDDVNQVTIASSSSLQKDLFEGKKGTSNKESAHVVGKNIAALLKEKGVEAAVFDRNGYMYHGKIKSLADGAREGGIQF